MISLDESDIQLLCALRDDSRLSLRDLGSKCSLSAPAVASRIRRLEQQGVIKGYTLCIADGVFGLGVEALVYTDVKTCAVKDYLAYMRSSLAVSSCLKIASEYSYMVMASFEDISHLNSFIEYLSENFGKTKVEIILNKEFIQRPPLTFRKSQA